jgi:DNA polymerase-3 subunit delta'
LLVTGPAGVGKRRLVTLLSEALLCAQPDERGFACRRCRECELLAAGTHPDYVQIGPDPDSKSDEIKVDAVRRLIESDALTAHRGRYKVVVLDPAQNLNASAANSLLKTLEEPSPDSLLCLVCERPGRLPATTRSRCQALEIPVPPEQEALDWLQGRTDAAEAAILLRLAHGAPLKALALAEDGRLPQREEAFSGFAGIAEGSHDPIAEAAAWNRCEPAIMLDWLSGWVGDLLRLAAGHPAPVLINQDKCEKLRSLAGSLNRFSGHRYMQQILAARATEDTTINRQLLYESLLVEWARIAGPRGGTVRQRG